jgi:hypothetical protein
MTDPISRRDAKEAMIALVLGILKPQVRSIWIREIEAAIDKIPALNADGRSLSNAISAVHREAEARLNADGRWEKLREELRLGIATWKESNIVCFTFRDAYKGILDLMDILGSPPAAERRPAVERPAMIRAQRKVEGWNEDLPSKWWQRIGGLWVAFSGSPGASTASFAESEWLVCVDRDNSDPEAIRLYDLDLTSGDAAQPGE